MGGAPSVAAMTDLHWQDVAAIGDAMRTRHVSPLAVLDAGLARIDSVGPQLDAFLWLDRKGARKAAQAAEGEIAGGRYRGPLHGVPVGIKDCIDVAGMPTTCHSKAMDGAIAKTDATVVRRLREAGAIILGKLAMHEFAIDGPDPDLAFPLARNPWNRDHHPGGSSSGCGAAVASGLLPLAIGTDAGGSVRHPASACGIVGLKPTYDLISREGAIPLAYTLDTLGPMARTVTDTALLLDAIAERRPNGAGSSYAVDLEQGVRGLRIGFVRHFHETDLAADDDTAAALDEVARVLAAEGAKVRTVSLPSLADFNVVVRTVLLAEAWSAMGPLVRSRPQDIGPMTRRRLLAGVFLSASDYINAQRRRTELAAAVESIFGDVDVLLVASSMCPACRIDDPQEIARTYPRQARGPFNVSGHPALAMMAGQSKDGMPLSVQFVAPYWQETRLLRVARAYERATRWHELRPTGTP